MARMTAMIMRAIMMPHLMNFLRLIAFSSMMLL